MFHKLLYRNKIAQEVETRYSQEIAILRRDNDAQRCSCIIRLSSIMR